MSGGLRSHSVGFIGGYNPAREQFLTVLAKRDFLSYVVGGPLLAKPLRRLCFGNKMASVGYWLSAIPIIPIIGKVIELACSAQLPNLFGNVSAPQPSHAVGANPATGSGAVINMNLEAINGAINVFRQTSFQGLMQTALSKLLPAQTLLTDFLVNTSPILSTTTLVQGIHSSQLLGASADVATARLHAAGVSVANVVRYDPSALGHNLASFSTEPETLPAGGSVSLAVNDQNQFVYYTRSSPHVAALQSQVQASQQQITQTADSLNHVSVLSQQLKTSGDATQQVLTASQPALPAAAALQSRVSNLETLTSTQQAALDYPTGGTGHDQESTNHGGGFERAVGFPAVGP
jgi:hypothetical protein